MVEQARVQLVFPAVVNVVVQVLQLECENRGQLPRSIESESLFARHWDYVEVIEEVPLVLAGRGLSRVGD